MLEDDRIGSLRRPLFLGDINLEVGIQVVQVPYFEPGGRRRIGPCASNYRLIESRVEQIDDGLHC